MLKANIIQKINYQGKDLEKLMSAVDQLEKTLNGKDFRLKVLEFDSFQFKRVKTFLFFKVRTIQDPVLKNHEILEKIYAGKAFDGEHYLMNLKLRFEEKNEGTAIGKTNVEGVINTYSHAFHRMSSQELSAHLAHEWMQTLGFTHSFSNQFDKGRDCYSVPYAIGNLVEIILTGKCFYNCKYI